MNNPITFTTNRSQAAMLATNKVIRNTYTLLSMTLVFSALTAGMSMTLNLPHPEHIAFADTLFRPLAGERISIDFQMIAPTQVNLNQG